MPVNYKNPKSLKVGYWRTEERGFRALENCVAACGVWSKTVGTPSLVFEAT